MNNSLKMQTRTAGEGTPVVLVPGGLTGWKSWEAYIEHFTEQHKKVICVQLLNVEFGVENRSLPDDYSVKTESHALAAALDSKGLTDAVDIVAWSYGALVTLDFALDHPERIRTLTMIEPPAIWILKARDQVDSKTSKTINFFNSLYGDITEEDLAAFLVEAGFTSPGQSPKDLHQWQQWLPYRFSLRNSRAVVSDSDDVERLRSFYRPVLLIKGTGSAHFLHQIINALNETLPDARMIELPGGHAPHIVSREKFLATLGEFLATAE